MVDNARVKKRAVMRHDKPRIRLFSSGISLVQASGKCYVAASFPAALKWLRMASAV